MLSHRFLTVMVLFIGGGGMPTFAQARLQQKALKTVRRTSDAEAVDLKNLAKPRETKGLQWQKVVVGQQTVDGARLLGLPPNSSWRRLGLQKGDVVLRIAGEDIQSEQDLNRAIEKVGPFYKDGTVDFKVLRENQVLLLDYKLHW